MNRKSIILTISAVAIATVVGVTVACTKEASTQGGGDLTPQQDTRTYNERMIVGKWWLESINDESPSMVSFMDEYTSDGMYYSTTYINMGSYIDTTVGVCRYSIIGDTIVSIYETGDSSISVIVQLDSSALVYDYNSADYGLSRFVYSRLD